MATSPAATNWRAACWRIRGMCTPPGSASTEYELQLAQSIRIGHRLLQAAACKRWSVESSRLNSLSSGEFLFHFIYCQLEQNSNHSFVHWEKTKQNKTKKQQRKQFNKHLLSLSPMFSISITFPTPPESQCHCVFLASHVSLSKSLG